MDNITHSLIGVLASELVQKIPSVQKKSPIFKRAIFWASILGNNFPDLDFLLKPINAAGQLGGIVHHRGFTHSFVFGLLGGTLCALAAQLFSGHQKHSKTTASSSRTTEFWIIIAMGILGNFLHVFADFWNDYGVHPFWPFSNRWFYGDSIFIVEPLIWLSLLPVALRAQMKNYGTRVWQTLTALIFALIFLSPILSLSIKAFLLVFVIFQYFFQFRKKQPQPFRALGSLSVILCIFGATSQWVSAQVKNSLPKSETSIDTVLSPAPSNPFCWRLISVALDSKGDLVSRVGTLSLWPSVFSAKTCHIRLASATDRTAKLLPSESLVSSTSRIDYSIVGERRLGLDTYLEAIQAPRCGLSAFLAWSRVPFWFAQDGQTLVGDIRYDREPGLGFAEVLTNPSVCTRLPIPWIPPLYWRIRMSSNFGQ